MSVPFPIKNKTKFTNIFKGGRWVVIVGLVILVGLGVALSRDVIRKTRIRKEVTALENNIGQLERRNEELSGLIEYFQSDTFKNREAREKLNVQIPGERVIEVQQPEVTAEKKAVQQELASITPKNNWRRWWLYLFAELE